jgi:DNA-binding response OmpR family regulator
MDKAKILVVDDKTFICKELKDRLTEKGYLAQSASSGEEALRMLGETPFDLVILDLAMPGMDGYELGRRMRATLATKGIKILVLTAKGDPADRLRAHTEFAPDAFMLKPFKIAELFAEITKLLNNKK